MHSQNIVDKLKALTILPMVIIAIGFVFFIIKSYNDLSELNQLQNSILKIKTISHLVNELQIERGLSSGYLADPRDELRSKIAKQREHVDKAFDTFIKTHSDSQLKSFYKLERRNLVHIRERVNHSQITLVGSFNYFTQLIKKMQNYYFEVTMHVNDVNVKNNLQAYTYLAVFKESLGEIRAALNAVFSKENVNQKLIRKAISASNIYYSSKDRFESTAEPKFLNRYREILNMPEYIWVENILQKFQTDYKNNLKVDPDRWFDDITKVINELYKLENYYSIEIDKYVSIKYKETLLQLVTIALIILVITILTLWLGKKIKEDILHNIILLGQYKSAVDRSSIVSKTDKRGKITYVNEKFCSISEYTQEELLGKSHNIVGHPDMPKAIFTDLWRTILNKQPWYGIIKNRKKSGESYTVEVTINPILDHNGEIEEFIAIRNDLSDVIKLHEELENTQEDLIFRMGEIGETRSQETGFHVRRVAKYSELLGKYYGLSADEIRYLTLASPMHDIGKVGIPDMILNKPGKLTPQEWEVMKEHAKIGYNVFKDSTKPLLKAAAIIAHEHHEKWDGSGYPRGLSGESIHIYGRITALADVFDALGSDRCYKKAWNDEDIFALIRRERGKHFDPTLVDIFFKHLDKFLEIRETYNEMSNFMRS